MQKDPVTLQLLPDCFANVARPLWSEVLVLRGVMSDQPGSAANTVLARLRSHLTKGKVDGLRPGSQIWPVIIAFPNRNPDNQNKSAWTVELMVTVLSSTAHTQGRDQLEKWRMMIRKRTKKRSQSRVT